MVNVVSREPMERAEPFTEIWCHYWIFLWNFPCATFCEFLVGGCRRGRWLSKCRGLNCATRCKKRGASLWRPFIKLVIYHTLHHVNSCKPKSDVLAQACCKKCQKWRNLRTPWRKQVLKTVTFWRNLSTSWRNLSGFWHLIFLKFVANAMNLSQILPLFVLFPRHELDSPVDWLQTSLQVFYTKILQFYDSGS